MEIYQIIAFALISGVIIIYLKSVNSEIAFLMSIAVSVLMLIMLSNYLATFLNMFLNVFNDVLVDDALISIILKVLAISYIIEFACSLLDDFNMKSLSEKVHLCGRVLILTMALPILENIITILTELL